MVKIRLQPQNSTKSYAIVAIDSKKGRDGAFIKKLGYYNPKYPDSSEFRLKIDLEALMKFVQNGAQLSETARKLVGKVANANEITLHSSIQAQLEADKVRYASKNAKNS